MSNNLLSQLINKQFDSFSETEKRLATHFIKLDNELTTKTIAQLSDETDISQTTIFNFVKKLGFKGFQQFKIQLATHQSQPISFSTLPYHSEISSDDNSDEIAQKIIESNIRSLNILNTSLSRTSLDEAINLITQSERLHFFGSGGSSIVALDAYHKFIRTKFSCNYIFDYHMQLSYSTKLNEGDCVFLFSHSGLSREPLNLARQLAKQKAKVIVMTGNPDSPLLKYAQGRFIISSEEGPFRSESLAARILYLTVVDIIYTNIMYKDEAINQEAMDKIRSALTDVKDIGDTSTYVIE